jgi:hypothetical protein
MSAPFVVHRAALSSKWGLTMRPPHYRFIGWFDTQAEAIDYAHKHWPWWP